MNDDFKMLSEPEPFNVGLSSIYKLFEAFIALRERNERQHKLFEQTINRTRDSLQSNFNAFAADTQKAFQSLRGDIVGEKKFSLGLLNELLDLAIELDHILSARPAVPGSGPETDACRRWMDSIEVQNRRIQESLRKFGIHTYDAVIGAAYNPALHERVGAKRMEGMDALRVAEQQQRGYASQQPEFILRRPKVLVTE